MMLLQRAGMSRSPFADSFRHTIGSTPGHYLQGWHTCLVQQALRRSHSLSASPSRWATAAKEHCRARSRRGPGSRGGSGGWKRCLDGVWSTHQVSSDALARIKLTVAY